MIDTVSNQYRQSINVKLDDPRAFELQFMRKDGKDSARCIIMGQEKPANVLLSPGSYTLRLRHLSDAPTRPVTKSMKITNRTAILNLSDMFPSVFDGVVYQPITAPHIGEMKQAIRQSRVRAKRSLEPFISSAFERNFNNPQVNQIEPSIKFESLEQASERGHDALKFEVGLSHNPASRDIGWADSRWA